ncbi:MAG: hypothetical protein LBU14_06060 [Candidatus Peribacteria bacterium]|nr:hypothetical protein [Candidatus Peribacteria bacterium]
MKALLKPVLTSPNPILSEREVKTTPSFTPPNLPLARGGTFCFVALYKGKCLKDKDVLFFLG